MFASSVTFLALVWCTFSVHLLTAEPISLQLLSDARNQMVVLPFNESDRKSIVQAQKTLLEAWVHRKTKELHYGDVFRQNGPESILSKIESNLTGLSDYDFQTQLAQVMEHTFDEHCSYNIPGPLACFSITSGIRIEYEGLSNSSMKFIVTGVSKIPEILSMSPNLKDVSVGDEVVLIDNMTPLEFLSTSNPIGMKMRQELYLTRQLDKFTVQFGESAPFPKKDNFSIQLHRNSHNHNENETDNATISLTLPWISFRKDACFKDSLAYLPADQQRHLQKLNETNASMKKSVFVDSSLRKDSSALFTWFPKSWLPGRQLPESLSFKNTSINQISWMIYNPRGENLGVIRLVSFYPGSSTAYEMLKIIRGLVLNELKGTSALLFDVRENGGGDIQLADRITQLFAPSVKRMKYQSLKNAFNDRIMKSPSMNIFYQEYTSAYSKTGKGSYYSEPSPMHMSAEEVFGMSYFKPVGVFTDIRCFSTCDAFSAIIQDNNAALIFGEGTHTGGGGSSVWPDRVLRSFLPDILPSYPTSNMTEYSEFGSSFQVSFNEMMRPNGGKIEDLGVQSNVHIPFRWTDLDTNASVYRPYSYIASQLLLGTGTNNRSLSISPFGIVPAFVDGSFSMNVSSSGYDDVQIQTPDGKVSIRLPYTSGTDPRANLTRHILLQHNYSMPGLYPIQCVGINRNMDRESVQGMIKSYLRILPKLQDFAPILSGQDLDFTSSYGHNLSSVIYTLPNGNNSYGWRKREKSDREIFIEYDHVRTVIDSQASMFTRVKPGSQVSVHLNLTYSNQKEQDFIYLGYMIYPRNGTFDNATFVELAKLSGQSGQNNTMQYFTFTSPLHEEYLEVFVKFVSPWVENRVLAYFDSFRISVSG